MLAAAPLMQHRTAELDSDVHTAVGHVGTLRAQGLHTLRGHLPRSL
jgi:hypothetical protein